MKQLGGILLVAGTTIGGGMLALPIATSAAGFINSSLLLAGCWFLMFCGALIILEVNLWLPMNSNIISMAKATLGRWGELVGWLMALLLLYSLLAAYMAGGGDLFKNLLSKINIVLPDWLTLVIFTLGLGYVVYHGVRSVDLLNRLLMLVKLGAFFLLAGCIMPNVELSKLAGGDIKSLPLSVTVAITSFGFAVIIPSLRIYFNNNTKQLRLVILFGSLLPLICYILWNVVIMGVIPREGSHGLIAMAQSGRSNSEFVNQLSLLLNSESVTAFARIFTSVCLLTSFLGVSLSLSDFLFDGLRLEKEGMNRYIIGALTFIPPMLIVMFYPGVFIKALSYAGVCCVVLLVLMPALMAWKGRYHKNMGQQGYQLKGGKPLLAVLIAAAILIIVNAILDIFVF